MSAWFFIVFRAFIILQMYAIRLSHRDQDSEQNTPNDGRLNNVFAVLIHDLENFGCLRLRFRFDGEIQVDANFLRLEACLVACPHKKKNPRGEKQNIPGFRSYCSSSSLTRTFAFTRSAKICVNVSLGIDVAVTSSESDRVSWVLY